MIERIERHLFADMDTQNIALWRSLFGVLKDLKKLKTKPAGDRINT